MASDFRIAEPVLSDRFQVTPGTVTMTETELQADSLIRAPETMVECPRNVLKIVGMDEVIEQVTAFLKRTPAQPRRQPLVFTAGQPEEPAP